MGQEPLAREIGSLLRPRRSSRAGRLLRGRDHLPNLPTEEVFTSSDPERTEGIVTSTKSLLVSGRLVSGLGVRFERGSVLQIDADDGAELMRELVRRDVDGSGRVGRTGRVFHDTLLDENAASHIALGSGFAHLAAEGAAGNAERVNSSAVHNDFMIGGPDVESAAPPVTVARSRYWSGAEWAL